MKIKQGFLICMALTICLMTGACAQNSFADLSEAAGVSNPHLEAWIEIPGADYVQPVMRHPQDDSLYAGRDAHGREVQGGSLYVQPTYNASGFTDPVTIIYGSSAQETAPLGKLQETFSGSFDQCRTILLHQRDGTKEYRVFAAVPYSSVHILHYYDFTQERRFNSFFNAVFSTRALGMHLDEASRPLPTDRVLILSASVRGDKTQRYLVLAKRITP